MVEFYLQSGLEIAVHQSHLERHCTFFTQVSQDTELFESFKFCLEDNPETTIHWWHWGRLWTFIVVVSQGIECLQEDWGLCISRDQLIRWSWNCHPLVILEKILYIHYSGLLGHRIHDISRVLFGRCLEVAGHLVDTLWEEILYGCCWSSQDRVLWFGRVLLRR